ncbi:MAG: hypothetical protein RLZZ505_859 [Verrucomicrobiota bacterium]|jgi:hypothetical protein
MFFQTLSKSPAILALLFMASVAFPLRAQDAEKKEPTKEEKVVDKKPEQKAEPEARKDAGDKPKEEEGKPAEAEKKTIDPDDEAAAEEAEADTAAVARPVPPDPIQVYGWREKIQLDGIEGKIYAKLDTGAYTSSIHAEETELFERDGKKWVRFIVTEPRQKDSPRVLMEAPLVRIARIKNPGGDSETREVVRLAFKIGERKLRGDFTLNNRSNMLSAVLIGRTTIRELGWIDPSRTNLADKKIMR